MVLLIDMVFWYEIFGNGYGMAIQMFKSMSVNGPVVRDSGLLYCVKVFMSSSIKARVGQST